MYLNNTQWSTTVNLKFPTHCFWVQCSRLLLMFYFSQIFYVYEKTLSANCTHCLTEDVQLSCAYKLKIKITRRNKSKCLSYQNFLQFSKIFPMAKLTFEHNDMFWKDSFLLQTSVKSFHRKIIVVDIVSVELKNALLLNSGFCPFRDEKENFESLM